MGVKTNGTKNKQATTIRQNEVLEAVAGLNLEGVSGNITQTQVEVQNALAALSGKMTEQLQILRNIEESIELKREELKQLFDIEAKTLELDELQALINATRVAWQEEQQKKAREFEEQRSERNKQWARTEEEYQYRTNMEHKKSEDGFSLKMLLQERANKDRQEELERDWSRREVEIKSRENEFAQLKAQVEAHPEVVRKEVNAAVAIASNSVKKEYEGKIVIAAKESEMAARLAEQEVNSLKHSIVKLQDQLDGVKVQLEQAHRDAKEVSAKALESASGRSALEALQKFLEKEPASKSSK